LKRGIYILANDNVIDDTLAFLNSLRQHSPDYPVLVIPYDRKFGKLARVLSNDSNIDFFQDQSLFDEIEKHTTSIHGRVLPLCRKFACWFGPFDEFIYFDTDILVLKDQRDVFDLLKVFDIVYCGSGQDLGIKHVFTERVFERNLFSPDEMRDTFNAGFFASKKGVLTHEQLFNLVDEAATVSDIFVSNLQDQPLMNYITLRAIRRRGNLRELAPTITADIWAGVKGLKIKDDKIYTKNGLPVRHIHWAGCNKPRANRPYVNLWLKYRYPGRFRVLVRGMIGSCFFLWKFKHRFSLAIRRRLITKS